MRMLTSECTQYHEYNDEIILRVCVAVSLIYVMNAHGIVGEQTSVQKLTLDQLSVGIRNDPEITGLGFPGHLSIVRPGLGMNA